MSSFPSRAFGIELEVILPRGMSHGALARHITENAVPCAAEGYNHALRNHWKVVHDGSIGRIEGAEVVSPKLYGEEGIQEARAVAKAVEAAGCKVNVKCGFHVHVDASGITLDHMRKVAQWYLWFETFFDHIVPASRRGCANSFIKSNRAKFGGYGTDALNRGFTALQAVTSIEDLITRVNGAEFDPYARYRKLNLASYRRHQTVEFRQHSGTVDADKVEHWVRFLVIFVERAKVSRPRLRSVTRDLTAAEEMRYAIGGSQPFFPISPETKAFLMARRRELVAADRAAGRASAEESARREAAQEVAQEAARLTATAVDPTIRYAVESTIAALEARRVHVMGYARPQRRVASQCRFACDHLADLLARGEAERALRCVDSYRRQFLPTRRRAA